MEGVRAGYVLGYIVPLAAADLASHGLLTIAYAQAYKEGTLFQKLCSGVVTIDKFTDVGELSKMVFRRVELYSRALRQTPGMTQLKFKTHSEEHRRAISELVEEEIDGKPKLQLIEENYPEHYSATKAEVEVSESWNNAYLIKQMNNRLAFLASRGIIFSEKGRVGFSKFYRYFWDADAAKFIGDFQITGGNLDVFWDDLKRFFPGSNDGINRDILNEFFELVDGAKYYTDKNGVEKIRLLIPQLSRMFPKTFRYESVRKFGHRKAWEGGPVRTYEEFIIQEGRTPRLDIKTESGMQFITYTPTTILEGRSKSQILEDWNTMDYVLEFKTGTWDNYKAEASFCRLDSPSDHTREVEFCNRAYPEDPKRPGIKLAGGEPQIETWESGEVARILQWNPATNSFDIERWVNPK
jgi:hypothetical protein